MPDVRRPGCRLGRPLSQNEVAVGFLRARLKLLPQLGKEAFCGKIAGEFRQAGIPWDVCAQFHMSAPAFPALSGPHNGDKEERSQVGGRGGAVLNSFSKFLASRGQANDVDYRLLIPLVAYSATVQTIYAIVRVTTSYRAIELDLPVVWLGVISATFAVPPTLLAVWVGRLLDRGYDAQAAWIGSGMFVLVCAGFWLFRQFARRAADAHGAVRRRPSVPDGEPADAVHSQRRAARPRCGVRQLRGRQRHRPGTRPLSDRLAGRLGDRAADRYAVRPGAHRRRHFARDGRGHSPGAEARASPEKRRRSCRCAH